jgi:beta-glucanase (GH16 family)
MKWMIIFLFMISCTEDSTDPGWSLVWSDEFNYNGLPDPSNWRYEEGFVRNNELQYYTKERLENSKVDNGNLMIIGIKESYETANYTSASLMTLYKQSWKYGKIEARIRLPEGQGLWPAFWTLGENLMVVGWPKCGEIDIMEHINNEEKIYGTAHWDDGKHLSSGGSVQCDVTEFHNYSVVWDMSSIKWYLDDNLYWTVSIKNNINSTEELHNPQYIILNMAIGGDWPQSPDLTTSFPDTMFVDYVRVYQLSGK